MAYTSSDDIKRYVTDDQFLTLQRDVSETYVSDAIAEAENYVKRRLGYKYDIDTEFAKSGDNRDETLIRIICMIAIYTLTLPFDLLDQEGKYFQQYERAMEDINKIEKGTLLSDYLVFQDSDKQQILYGKDEDAEIKY